MIRRLRWVAAGTAFVSGFAFWVTAAEAQDRLAQGMKLFATHKCTQCHSIEGKPPTAVAKKGPLDGVGDKLSEDELRQWIVDAVGMAKKTKSTRKPAMKNYSQLPKEDVDALVAYMRNLKKG